MTGPEPAVADSAAALFDILAWAERERAQCEVAVVLPRHARTRSQLWRTARLARDEGLSVGLYGTPLALAPRLAAAARVVVGVPCSRPVRMLVSATGTRDVVQAGTSGHAWLRRRFGPPAVFPGTDLLGAPGVPVDDIATLAHGLNAERYFAHSREGDQRLRRPAAQANLDVVRPELALEIELLRGPVATDLVTLRPAPWLRPLLSGTGVSLLDAPGTDTAASSSSADLLRLLGR